MFQENFITFHENTETTNSFFYANFSNLFTLIDNEETVLFSLPGSPESLEFEIKMNKKFNFGGTGISGIFQNESGNFILAEREGFVSGTIQVKDNFYSVLPIKNGVSLVIQTNKNIEIPFSCSTSGSSGEFCGEECTNVSIDVLLVYTPDVTTYMSSAINSMGPSALFNYIIGGIASFEAALINSGATNFEMRYSMMPSPPDFVYSDPLNAGDDLQMLHNTTKPMRESAQSDIVVLISSMNYGTVLGKAMEFNLQTNESFPSSSTAFAMVTIQSMYTPLYVFAHEIGHIFNARHNRSSNLGCTGCGEDDNPNCGHGWRFTLGGPDRTIMSPNFPNLSFKIPNFSNPDVLFGNFPTGDYSSNNVRQIEATACQVQNYRPSNFWEINIVGQTQICNEQGDVSLLVDINQPTMGLGAPPYTYQWNLNMNSGYSAFAYLTPNSGNPAQAHFQCPTGCEFTVNLIVTAADGATLTDDLTITVLQPPCAVGGQLDDRKYTIDSKNSDFSVTPNPSSGIFQIQSEHLEEMKVTVYNSLGKALLKKELTTNEFLDLSMLPDGNYSATILINGELFVKYLTKSSKN